MFILRFITFVTRFVSEDEEYESKAYRVSMIEAESREDYQNKKEDEEEMTNSAAYRGLQSALDAIKALVGDVR